MINLLIESVFSGFVVFSFAMLLLRFFVRNGIKHINKELDSVVIDLFHIAGIVFVLHWLLSFYSIVQDSEYWYIRDAVLYRLLGRYCFDNWMYILLYVFSLLISWLRLVIHSYILRIPVAFGLIFGMERLVALLTSFHRWSVTNPWVMEKYVFTENLLYNFGTKIVLFMCMVGVTYWVKIKIRK